MSNYLNNQFKTRVKQETVQLTKGEYRHLNFVLKYGETNVDGVSLGYMIVKGKDEDGNDLILRHRLFTYDINNEEKIKGDMLSLLHNDLFDCTTKYDIYDLDDEANNELNHITIAIAGLVWNYLIEREEDKIERVTKLCKDVLEDRSLSFDNRIRALMLHFTAELNKSKGDGIIVSNESILSGSEE